MSGRRGRIIAAQAAAVALLVAAIYLTLLQPDGLGPLRGIDAPGAGGGDSAQQANGGGGPAPETGAAEGAAVPGPGATPLTTLFGIGPSPAGPASGPNGRNARRPTTPADDQYDDTATALLRRLHGGG